MSGRDCSFTSQVPIQLDGHSASSTPAQSERSTSPGNKPDQKQTPPTASLLNATEGSSPNAPHQNPSPDDAVNFHHMELLIHLSFDKEIWDLSGNHGNRYMNLHFALKTGLEAPYLLHQALAFSARHLAFLHPERSSYYLHQAYTLQTRAISLFSALKGVIDKANCVPLVLFSSILGHHLLTDTLAMRDPGGLEAFISNLVQCVGTNRGIFNVVMTGWPLLMESELAPMLAWSTGFTSQDPKGNEFQRIKDLISNSESLSDEDKEVCLKATRYLQVGLDAIHSPEPEKEEDNRYRMLFIWTMLAPPQLTTLLAAKNPEALVLLGYYAVLLHHGQHLWQIRDAGAYILGLILGYLGPEWDHWLEYPKQIIAQNIRELPLR